MTTYSYPYLLHHGDEIATYSSLQRFLGVEEDGTSTEDNLTPGMRKCFVVTSMVGGGISFFSALLVLAESTLDLRESQRQQANRTRRRRGAAPPRAVPFMFATLALAYGLWGLSWAVGPVPGPRTLEPAQDYQAYETFWHVGNDVTCTMQGFVKVYTLAIASVLNATIVAFYMLMVKYNWTEARLFRAAVWVNAISWTAALGVSVPPILLGFYRFNGRTCYIHVPASLLCENVNENNSPTQDDSDCIHTSEYNRWVNINSLFPHSLCIFAVMVMFIIIYRTVWNQETRVSQNFMRGVGLRASLKARLGLGGQKQQNASATTNSTTGPSTGELPRRSPRIATTSSGTHSHTEQSEIVSNNHLDDTGHSSMSHDDDLQSDGNNITEEYEIDPLQDIDEEKKEEELQNTAKEQDDDDRSQSDHDLEDLEAIMGQVLAQQQGRDQQLSKGTRQSSTRQIPVLKTNQRDGVNQARQVSFAVSHQAPTEVQPTAPQQQQATTPFASVPAWDGYSVNRDKSAAVRLQGMFVCTLFLAVALSEIIAVGSNWAVVPWYISQVIKGLQGFWLLIVFGRPRAGMRTRVGKRVHQWILKPILCQRKVAEGS